MSKWVLGISGKSTVIAQAVNCHIQKKVWKNYSMVVSLPNYIFHFWNSNPNPTLSPSNNNEDRASWRDVLCFKLPITFTKKNLNVKINFVHLFFFDLLLLLLLLFFVVLDLGQILGKKKCFVWFEELQREANAHAHSLVRISGLVAFTTSFAHLQHMMMGRTFFFPL